MAVIDLLTLDPTKVIHFATRRGWVRKDIARAARLSTAPITKVFKRRGISPRTAKKIADALGVTIPDLLTEEL